MEKSTTSQQADEVYNKNLYNLRTRVRGTDPEISGEPGEANKTHRSRLLRIGINIKTGAMKIKSHNSTNASFYCRRKFRVIGFQTS